MLVIEFNCRNQRLSRYTAGVIASNSYGYLKFKFNFKTNDWDDVSVKMANFSYKGRNYPILIDEDNICTVPKEVIKTPGFIVSVFGGGITTNTVKVPVENSNISYIRFCPTSDTSFSRRTRRIRQDRQSRDAYEKKKSLIKKTMKRR